MDTTKFIGYIRLYLNTGLDDKKYVTCLLTETRLKDMNYYPVDAIERKETYPDEPNLKLVKDVNLSLLDKYLMGSGYCFDTDGMNRFTHADIYTQETNIVPSSKEKYVPPSMRHKHESNNSRWGNFDKNHKIMSHQGATIADFEDRNNPYGNFSGNRAKISASPNKSFEAEKKYERFRTSLFSKIDENMLLDNESWYSVTPEVIAKHIADRMKFQCILDGFCGSGGNLIQFALNGSRVIAVDRDPTKIAHANHNLGVYGARGPNVHLWNMDFELAIDRLIRSKDYSVDCVFLDPPWGGMDYYKKGVFDLDRLTYNLASIYSMSLRLTPNVIFKFPRKSNICQIASLLKANGVVEVEKTYLNGRLKFLILYFGQCIHEKYAKLIPTK